MVRKLAEGAERDGKTNVAFLTYFLQGRLDKCLDLLIKTNRLPEAAFLARTYLPSHVSRVVKLWKESLFKVNQKAADALADPTQYGNLFPGLQRALLAEQYLKETHVSVRPAAEYPLIVPNEEYNVLEESAGFVSKKEASEPQDLMENMSGCTIASVPASSTASPAAPEPAEAEEPLQIKQEITDPVSIKGDSAPRASSHLLVTIAEENVEPNKAALRSEVAALEALMDVVPRSEKASVSVEEVILEESVLGIHTEEPEMGPSSPIKDGRCSVEEDIQEISPAYEAVSAACGSESPTETTDFAIGTYEAPSEAMGTETDEALLSSGLTVDGKLSESIATGEMETNVISSNATAIIDFTAEETCVIEECVSEIVPSPPTVEELISFQNTASLVSETSVPVQILPHLAFDPLPDPLEDKMPVLEPIPAQVSEQMNQSTAFPSKPEDNLEVSLETDVFSPAAAPTEVNITGEVGPEDSEKPAEHLEAKTNEEDLDDLDLDHFDLEDIDTTDVNLDEELSE
ncbi:hypothetical protein Q5P01_009885 [Channa striata]|uniref:COPA/B TPR domain-containing protein n=1 Tax=Channa striata TaxID=64152 RepID=A0AA88N1Q0_CHASR|nr:hypothetical protein Q5P01_009885 [Channa striata]